MTTLFPYQRAGAEFLASRQRAMLLDEQGLGKTAQAIEACNLVGAQHVLVICPASVRSGWRREFDRFGRGQSVVVESFDKVSRDWRRYDGPWDALIVDEAHYIKSKNALRTRAIYGDGKTLPGIVRTAAYAWSLTGTPAPNNAAELYTHMRGLNPASLAMASDESRTYDEFGFIRRYCTTRETQYGTKIVGTKNLDDLKARLAPWTLRRLKKDVLTDMPALTYSELAIDAPAAVAALKDIPGDEMALLRDIMKDGDAAALQAATMHLAELRRLTAAAKVPALAEWAHDFLDQTDRKLVIFGHHVEPLKHLHALLRRTINGERVQPAIVTGDSAHRQKAIDRFQTDPDCRVFIGQIQAAGTGITLTAASDLVFLEQSWVPADNAQAAMRIHRIGQTRGCSVRFMTLAGSIDEAVQRTLARKTKDLSQLFD
jgi:SWI/SNF-related matrix-associated actin-dependent regulator of chromatin subfamily A-like protein 1